MTSKKKKKKPLNKLSIAQEENKDVVWSKKDDEDLLDFYNDKQIKSKQGNLGKEHWIQCAEKMNIRTNENNLISKQCKGKRNSTR
jgi:hypothetical protein